MASKAPLFDVTEEGKVKTFDAEGKPIEVELDDLPEDLKEGVINQSEELEKLADSKDSPEAAKEELDEIMSDVTPRFPELEPWVLSEEKE